MKSYLFLVILIPLFTAMNSCDAQEGKYEDVSKEVFTELIESGKGILLDVRTPDEFSEGHIKGAVNLDYFAKDFEDQIANMDKSIPVYVYCASGGRSGLTKKLMKKEGFEKVSNLSIGYEGWVEE